ncbi:MAG TPA: Uma2 family endonuclease [Thermoanaerobaculia bacterium]|nr:Uma2 family endonuclease [Thermoanaerobaculia bacterium]
MAEADRKRATYADLTTFPESVHAEIVAGDIYVHPSGLPRHGHVTAAVSGMIGMPFSFDPKGPGGWWIVSDVDIALSTHDVVRPDLSGWRRARVPVFPRALPVSIVPDWVCEVLSPSNARYDRITKADLYARHAIPFYWIVDPAARVLEAFERQGAGWLRLGAWGDGDKVPIRPFDAVDLDVGRLFPPPEEGEIASPMSVSEAIAAYGAV